MSTRDLFLMALRNLWKRKLRRLTKTENVFLEKPTNRQEPFYRKQKLPQMKPFVSSRRPVLMLP